MTLREYLSQLPQNPYRDDAPLLRVRERSFQKHEVEKIKPGQIYCVMYKQDPVKINVGVWYMPVLTLFTQKPDSHELASDHDMQALFGFLTQEDAAARTPVNLVTDDEAIAKQKTAKVRFVQLALPLLQPQESRELPLHLMCQMTFHINFQYF
jgi:hypothetical protein